MRGAPGRLCSAAERIIIAKRAEGAGTVPPYAAALSALLLAACAARGCLPPPESAERIELRVRLQPLIHRSQCPGPPTPAIFQAQEAEYSRRKAALIERVARSPAAEDLARARREDEEMNRNVTAAECNTMFWDRPDDPENVAAYPARLRAELQELRAAEAAFTRVVAGCKTP